MAHCYFEELPRPEDFQPSRYTEVLVVNSRLDQPRVRVAVALVIKRHSASFDMHTGRLFVVSRLPGAPDRLVLTASRLRIDEQSWQTVVDDLVSQYGQGVLASDSRLSAKTSTRV